MRELAILTFVSADGVMQAPKMQEEDPSGGLTTGLPSERMYRREFSAIVPIRNYAL